MAIRKVETCVQVNIGKYGQYVDVPVVAGRACQVAIAPKGTGVWTGGGAGDAKVQYLVGSAGPFDFAGTAKTITAGDTVRACAIASAEMEAASAIRVSFNGKEAASQYLDVIVTQEVEI